MSGPSLNVRRDLLTSLPINHIYYTRQGQCEDRATIVDRSFCGLDISLKDAYRVPPERCVIFKGRGLQWSAVRFPIMSLPTMTVAYTLIAICCFFKRILRENLGFLSNGQFLFFFSWIGRWCHLDCPQFA